VADTKTDTTKTPLQADAKTEALKAQVKDSDQAKADAPKGALAPAGQSGDPTVQKLLAEREIHRQNAGLVDDEQTKRNRDEAKKKIDEIDKQLEDLGYTAK